MASENDLEYDDDLIDGLELIWGDGFLSPGGVEEVALLLDGIDLGGKEALDIGCGLGGPSCALVEQHKAKHVIAIDIEPPIIDRAKNRASARNSADQVDFKLVTPGQLPFDDSSFDLVFSKDAFIHVEDKSALFRECLRVLREDGWIVLSDWYCGSQTFSSEMEAWLEREAKSVTFHITTLSSTAAILGDLGFVNVTSTDRNDWYQKYTKEELERLSGSLRDDFVDRFGEQEAQDWVDGILERKEVVDQGHLRPGHLRGQKPKTS
jgi:ubiquinone/menaquinone biosynthesis C-methylase UbiE